MSEPNEQVGAAAPAPGPGMLVKLARERAGLGVDDLASQIKLARNTLEALERDDFAALSEPVYVRGYYRKIAKALGASERELLDAYALRNPTAEAPVRAQPLPLAGGVEAGTSRRSQGQGFLLVAGLAVLGVVVMVLLAEPPRTARLNRPGNAPVAEPAALPPAQSTPADGSSPSNVPEAAGAEPAAPVNAGAPTPQVSAPAQAAPSAAPAASASVPPGSATQLLLQFSESSFARVEDSRGRTLLVGLVKGGEQTVLDGQPPYTVFLGNATNVKVIRNGQVVDFSADLNPQNNTARFTVP